MSPTVLHPLAQDYLERLDRIAGERLPRSERSDLVEEIRGHLAETAPAGTSDADVRTALDRLGSPEAIVDAAAPAVRMRRRGAHEWFAIFGLLLGGFVIPVLGWLVGVILLWTSRAWSTKDKLIGTLVVPGGLGMVWLVLVLAATVAVRGSGPLACSDLPKPVVRATVATSRSGAAHIGRITVTHLPASRACVSSSGGTSLGDVLLPIGLVALLLAPFGTSVYLAVRAQPHPA
jgi:hypothetical protein